MTLQLMAKDVNGKEVRLEILVINAPSLSDASRYLRKAAKKALNRYNYDFCDACDEWYARKFITSVRNETRCLQCLDKERELNT